jgi:hypothetical protein
LGALKSFYLINRLREILKPVLLEINYAHFATKYLMLDYIVKINNKFASAQFA